MLGSYFLVCVTMWIVARFSPLEWKEPELCDECLLEMYSDDSHECDVICDACDVRPSEIGSPDCSRACTRDDECMLGYGEPRDRLEVLENEFTLGNSFWFGVGTLMQQGSNLNPEVRYFSEHYVEMRSNLGPF